MIENASNDTEQQPNSDVGTSTGSVIPAWHESLPDDLKSNENITGHENVEALARSYVDLQGKQPVVPKSNEYQYELPEGVTLDETQQQSIDNFKAIATKLGITQRQFKGLIDYEFKTLTQAGQRATESRKAALEENKQKAIDSLTDEWKQDFDSNMEKVKKVKNLMFEEDFNNFLNETGLGNDVRLMKGLLKIASQISEDVFINGKLPPAGLKRGADGRPILQYPSMEAKT